MKRLRRYGVIAGALALVSAQVLSAAPPSPAAQPFVPSPIAFTSTEECAVYAGVEPVLASQDGFFQEMPVDVQRQAALVDLQSRLLSTGADDLSRVVPRWNSDQLVGLDAYATQSPGRPWSEVLASALSTMEPFTRALVAESDVAVVAREDFRFSDLCAAFEDVSSIAVAPENLEGETPDVVSFGISLSQGAVEMEIADSVSLPQGRTTDLGLIVTSQWQGSAPEFTHRSNDLNGFNAGDSILVGNAPCTASFNLRNNNSGSSYLLTAGHCGWGQSSSVRNGTTLCWNGLSGFSSMGTFGSSLFNTSTSSIDVAAIRGGGPYSSRMWAGSACTGWGEAAVVGYISTYSVGTVVGFSGHVSGQRDGAINAFLDSPNCFQAYLPGGALGRACNVVRASSTNAEMCTGGDSGGPVFAYYSDSRVLAAGVISGASSETGGGLTRYHCYFTRITTAMYLYNSGLVTGA